MALRKMDHNKNRIQSKPVAIIDLTSDDEENAVQIKKELSTAVASGRVVKQKTRIKTLVNAPTVLKSIGESNVPPFQHVAKPTPTYIGVAAYRIPSQTSLAPKTNVSTPHSTQPLIQGLPLTQPNHNQQQAGFTAPPRNPLNFLAAPMRPPALIPPNRYQPQTGFEALPRNFNNFTQSFAQLSQTHEQFTARQRENSFALLQPPLIIPPKRYEPQAGFAAPPRGPIDFTIPPEQPSSSKPFNRNQPKPGFAVSPPRDPILPIVWQRIFEDVENFDAAAGGPQNHTLNQQQNNYDIPFNTKNIPTAQPNRRLTLSPHRIRNVAASTTTQRAAAYQTYLDLQELDEASGIVTNSHVFECGICFTYIEPNDGITFRNCLHNFCKECTANHIIHSEEFLVKCPFTSNDFNCTEVIQDREMRALLTDEQFEKHLMKSLNVAEQNTTNSFHCKLPNCPGWCECEEQVTDFVCPVCQSKNCINCGAIHTGKNCGEFQSELTMSESDLETKASIDKLIADGEAMRCPKCQIVIVKRSGCDALLCTMCRTEICWVTRGFRWGPKGYGDTSGGCQCRVNGKKCHPRCGNCH